jgi:Zn-dependent protease with chaperone function
MKRGIKFQPLPNSPVWATTIERNQGEILGIPVEFSSNHGSVADARGFFGRKKIVVGPAWLKLDERVQRAVLLHEAHHCKSFHLEQRIVLLILMVLPILLVLPWTIIAVIFAVLGIYGMAQWVARLMEEAADGFAVEQGYGLEMARFLKSSHIFMPKVFYPDFESRMRNIERAIKERDKT